MRIEQRGSISDQRERAALINGEDERVPEKRSIKTARKRRENHRTAAPGPELVLTVFTKQGKVLREKG
ncbi:uncharacterized [Tachysurus ichikawai]